MSDNQHFDRLLSCLDCGWAGQTGQLIASGRSPDLLCPQCDSPDIKYLISDAPLTQH